MAGAVETGFMDGGKKAEAARLPLPFLSWWKLMGSTLQCWNGHVLRPFCQPRTDLTALAGVNRACFRQNLDSSLRTREKHSLREAAASVLPPWAHVPPSICVREEGSSRKGTGRSCLPQTSAGAPGRAPLCGVFLHSRPFRKKKKKVRPIVTNKLYSAFSDCEGR